MLAGLLMVFFVLDEIYHCTAGGYKGRSCKKLALEKLGLLREHLESL